MVIIYSKDYCPFCVQAKNLLASQNISYQEIDITDDPETLQKIMQISKMRTVPQIFVGENHCLGGYSDIAELHKEGKLLSTIEKFS